MLKSNISDVYSRPSVCKEFHDVLVMSMGLNKIVILNIIILHTLSYVKNE